MKYKTQTIIKTKQVPGGFELFIKSPELFTIWRRAFYLEAYDKDARERRFFPSCHSYADLLDEVREQVLAENTFNGNYLNNSHFYQDIFQHTCGITQLMGMRMEESWFFNKDNERYNYVPLIKSEGLDVGVTYKFSGMHGQGLIDNGVEVYRRAIEKMVSTFLTA